MFVHTVEGYNMIFGSFNILLQRSKMSSLFCLGSWNLKQHPVLCFEEHMFSCNNTINYLFHRFEKKFSFMNTLASFRKTRNTIL